MRIPWEFDGNKIELSVKYEKASMRTLCLYKTWDIINNIGQIGDKGKKDEAKFGNALFLMHS